ncbi:hypothetical protein D9V84_10965, partial [Bacteroidetes/Chlorobi group bacterium Naka2016]
MKSHFEYLELKNLSFVFLFLLAFFNRLLSSDFELTPLNMQFYGAETIGNRIIVYASDGNYLLSTDAGKTWSQHLLNPNGHILHMVNFKDTLFGVLSNGYILISSDSANSWTKIPIELDEKEELIYITPTEKNTFVRSTKGIYKFDKNWNLLKVRKDSLIETAYWKNFEHGIRRDLPTLIGWAYRSSQVVIPLYYYDKKLLLQSLKYRNGLIVLDEDLNFIDTVNNVNYIKSQEGNRIRFVYTFPNSLIFTTYPLGVYKTNDIFSAWENYFADTNFVKQPFFEFPYNEKTLFGIYKIDYSFFFWNNKLYFETIETNPTKRNLVTSYVKKYNFPIIYSIYQIDIDETGTRYSVKLVGNRFYDNSIAAIILDEYPSTIIDNATFNLYHFRKTTIGDSILIIPADNKTLLITRDGCQTWNLLSCNNGQPSLIVNDSIFVNSTFAINNIFVSFDSGLFYKPTGYGLDTMHRYIEYTGFDSTGKLIDTVYHFIDTVSYFHYFSNSQILHIDKNGKGFWVGSSSGSTFGPKKEFGFAYTTDYGLHFKFDTVLANKVGYRRKFSGENRIPNSSLDPVFTIDGNYVYGGFKLLGKTKFISSITFIDTNFKDAYTKYFDQNIQLFQIYPFSSKNILLFCNVFDSTDPNAYKFVIRETTDTGNTFVTISSLDTTVEMPQFYPHNQDSIFFTLSLPGRVYLFEPKHRKLTKLYETDLVDTVYLMVISDRFYIVGKGLFLENTDRSDLTQWREGKWDYGKPNFESVIFKGNVAIAGLSDSLRPFNYYKITLKKETPTTVESQVEKRYYTTKFWASEPYPQPAGVP